MGCRRSTHPHSRNPRGTSLRILYRKWAPLHTRYHTPHFAQPPTNLHFLLLFNPLLSPQSGYIEDAEIEMRSHRAMALLQASPKLRELLSSTLSNRSTCSVKISEGKEDAFKKKITGQPGGIEKWDGYRVRMTVDSLNDCKQAIQVDPQNHKAWFRVGYCTHRLIKLIDRIRERKAWLREEELPILDKPSMWEEARESLVQSLELLKKEKGSSHTEIKTVHDKLVEVYQGYQKMTCSIRKLGHENLGMTVDDKTLVMEGVDEKGPSEKWGAGHFVGCKLTHMRVGDEGAMLPIKNVADLAKRQTHSSYVTCMFSPKKALPQLPSLKLFLPQDSEQLKSERFLDEDDDDEIIEIGHVEKGAATAAKQPAAKVAKKKEPVANMFTNLPKDAEGKVIWKPKNPANAEKWGPPPVRPTKKPAKGVQPQLMMIALSVFVVFIAMIFALLN